MLLTDARRAARRRRDRRAGACSRSRTARSGTRGGSPRGWRCPSGPPRAARAPYAIQAAIAAVHASAPSAAETEWERIVRLYEWLALAAPRPWSSSTGPSAVGEAEGPERGLEI